MNKETIESISILCDYIINMEHESFCDFVNQCKDYSNHIYYDAVKVSNDLGFFKETIEDIIKEINN